MTETTLDQPAKFPPPAILLSESSRSQCVVIAPTGAVINAESGLFTWRPAIFQAGQASLITLKVQNSARTSLSATPSFTATINAVASPQISDVQLTDGNFGFLVNGSIGPEYLIQTSTNLTDGETILNTNPVALPFLWTSPVSPVELARLHRILLGP